MSYRRKPLPPLDDLLSRLCYDEKTGVLTWRIDVSQRKKAGSIAGKSGPRGYVWVTINYVQYLAHRIIWAMYYGEPPPAIIDHIDGNPSNNAIENLRSATNRQNLWNAGPTKRSKTGIRGVCQLKSGKKRWRADIRINGRLTCLGFYATAEEASEAYKQAAISHRGDYAKW